MPDLVLHTSELCKKYGGKFAVDHVSISVKRGDIYGLVGKNGAGKTTLLRLISGLSPKTYGNIELFGETSEAGLGKARYRTGCIIETPNFFPYLSARKNLEYYRIERGITQKESIDELLSLTGLSDCGKKKFKNFSLGMKQRLGLALALLGKPDLLLLDEPINGLDPMGIVQFREILKKLNIKNGTTILISSHILGELSQIATNYGFIHNGRLIEEISSKDIVEKCRQYVSIRVDNPEKASQIIKSKLDCSDFEVLDNNEIRIYKYIDTPGILNKTLVKDGIMVSSLNVMGASLESYYIGLIGGGQNDQAGQSGTI